MCQDMCHVEKLIYDLQLHLFCMNLSLQAVRYVDRQIASKFCSPVTERRRLCFKLYTFSYTFGNSGAKIMKERKMHLGSHSDVSIGGRRLLTELYEDLPPLCFYCCWSPPPSVSLPPLLHHHPAQHSNNGIEKNTSTIRPLSFNPPVTFRVNLTPFNV